VINIPTLRTKRLTVQMKELSIMDAIALASIPPDMNEEATSFFLRATVGEVSGVVDVSQWTVQERTLATCHYMASTFDDGPNFALMNGECHYSDYLMGDHDYRNDKIDIGEIEGDKWVVRQLTGELSCAIERLRGEIAGFSNHAHWQFGLMAAQLVPNGDAGEGLTAGALDEFLLARMKVIASYPESVFTLLLARYQAALSELEHLLRLSFDGSGILVVPNKQEGSAAIRPARFPVSTCVTSLAKELGGKSEDAGT